MALGKKTGGRRKGSLNKATAHKEQAIAASGLTPLDWMLSVLRDKTVDYDRRDRMAKAAAPYVHPQLSAVKHSGDLTVRYEDMLEQLGSETARTGALGGSGTLRRDMPPDQDQDRSDPAATLQ